MWHIGPFLGNDSETNNETTTIARQQLRKYTTVLESLLGSGHRATIEILLEAVFSLWSAPRLYHSTDGVQLVQCRAVGWSSVELRADSCETAGKNVRTEAENTVKTQQVQKT
jgi:hypothetical protein